MGPQGSASMGDTSIVHVGENSPEYVAFRLMEKIAASEGRIFNDRPNGTYQSADREWILSTYRECLSAVLGPRGSAACSSTPRVTNGAAPAQPSAK